MPKNIGQIDLVAILAVWGAIVSTIAVTWNALRDIGDKGKLRLEAMIGTLFGDPTGKNHLVFTMTNVGRRPIMVIKLGGDYKKGSKDPHFVIMPKELPKMLKEGEFHIEFYDDLSSLSPEVIKICAWDSSGKEWKLRKKNLKRLLEDARKLGYIN